MKINMLKKLLTLVVMQLAWIPVTAQNYSTDATLLNDTGSYAVIQCSGIGANKKDATEMAKKSAIYTYLYSGITGLNKNQPLLGIKPSNNARDYADKKILGTTNYAMYIKNCTIADRTNKTADKQIQVFATIELYYSALERALVNAGVIGKNADQIAISETQNLIAMPTIMVVPFKNDNETYKEALHANPDVQMAISKINEGFIAEGIETKDIITCINNADMYMARMSDGMSLDDMILANSGADVAVSVKVIKNENPQGLQVSLILRAIEIATGNTIADKSETSGRKRATAEAICAPMARYMVGQGGFMKQIATRLATKISTGQSIAVYFTIDPYSSVNMETEINNILPLSDILISWVKRHAQGGRYHSQGRTDTMLAFSDIYIDNSVEDGMQSDINDFALALYQYLKGLNLDIRRTITGNRLDITIL